LYKLLFSFNRFLFKLNLLFTLSFNFFYNLNYCSVYFNYVFNLFTIYSIDDFDDSCFIVFIGENDYFNNYLDYLYFNDDVFTKFTGFDCTTIEPTYLLLCFIYVYYTLLLLFLLKNEFVDNGIE